MKTLPLLLAMVVLISCSNQPEAQQTVETSPKGSLFIIGGGKRPVSLVQNMIKLSGVDKQGYIVILPMSSSEPDTSAWYAKRQFTQQEIHNVTAFNFEKGKTPKQVWLDSLRNATMIYISGGDQNKFMDVVLNSPIYEAMHTAYSNGAMIAGTSAGAAVMSKKMITGNEHKHPEYTGDFRTIEAENIEIAEGMGFTDKIIVDQHFIWRMRMNRLISVAIEHPEALAIGIDESTAIYVKNEKFKIYGKSQVIVIDNQSKSQQANNGLLGAQNMKLHVLLPGEELKLK
ncbi:MAG: cyanophycinase [Salinivirgaceae bacterium]|jgi:cyanophycinase|nr:cyanophycinase [Salinivirgaceae bacterium]